MAVAYIALGSNLGDRAANIRAALAKLHDPPAVIVERSSRLLATRAVGGPADSPNFLNAAAELTTELSPGELMQRLLDVEAELGRDRSSGIVNAPREIDLDLLLYDTLVVESEQLSIPHSRMAERKFVLAPLVEIAPDLIHPVSGTTMRELLREIAPK